MRREKIPGGLAKGKSPKDFPSKALQKGIKVELEHTPDEDVAREISMDHLMEDRDYYEKLEKIEKHSLTQPLSLRASYQKDASRAIPIDKSWARAFTKEAVKKMLKYLWEEFYLVPGKPSDPNIPIQDQRRYSKNWQKFIGIFKTKTVTGEKIELPILIRSGEIRFEGSREFISGGEINSTYQRGPKGRAVGRGSPYRITIRFNPKKSWAAFRSWKSRVEKEFYSVLIHEMTHAVDYLRSEYDSDKTLDTEETVKDYLNSPTEVRAHMQQVVDEVLERTKESIIRSSGWGENYQGRHWITKAFTESLTGMKIYRYLTPKNKKLAFKILARALGEKVPQWLEQYGDFEKIAGKVIPFPKQKRKHYTFPIGGKKYISSKFGGFLGKVSRYSFLWVLNVDKNRLASWRLSDGESKSDNRVGAQERRYIFELEKRGELNRVSDEEYLKIWKNMNQRAKHVLQQMKAEHKAQENQAERNFRWVAEQYFDNTIVPFFFDTYIPIRERFDQGVPPIGFKYISGLSATEGEQLARWVMFKVMEKYWDEDKIFSYAKLRRTHDQKLPMEGMGNQDAYFIMTDIWPDKTEEFWKNFRRNYRRVKLASLPFFPTKDRKGNLLSLGDQVKLYRPAYYPGTGMVVASSYMRDMDGVRYQLFSVIDEDGDKLELKPKSVQLLKRGKKAAEKHKPGDVWEVPTGYRAMNQSRNEITFPSKSLAEMYAKGKKKSESNKDSVSQYRSKFEDYDKKFKSQGKSQSLRDEVDKEYKKLINEYQKMPSGEKRTQMSNLLGRVEKFKKRLL